MRQRKSAVIVLFVLSGVMLFSVMALAIDVGFWYSRRTQRQMSADLALLASMAALDTSKPLDTQQAFVRSTAIALLTANGYQSDEWTVEPEPDASSSYVARATITNDHVLPTFFLGVVSAARPNMRTVAVVVGTRKAVALPPCALVATGTAQYSGAGGGVLDSFDSRAGGYNATQLQDNKLFDRSNASLCTNGPLTYGGNVAQFGSIYSHGDATLRGGAALIGGDITTGGQVSITESLVTGQIESGAAVPHFVLPPAEAPADIATSNANSLIRIEKNGVWDSFDGTVLREAAQATIHLVAGRDYYFTSVALNGGASILIDGTLAEIRNAGRPTRIFVAGDFSAVGGIQFQAALDAAGSDLGGLTAADLSIIGLATDGDIVIGGGSKIIADIYAPFMDVTLAGTQHTFGRIRARDITIDGTANFSFDEALGCEGASTDTYRVQAHLVQ